MSDKVVTLTIPVGFWGFYGSVKAQHGMPVDTKSQPILALDPGETTGWAYFDGGITIEVGQQVTKEIGPSFDWLHDRLVQMAFAQTPEQPRAHLRYEDYRVYEWKAKDHSWSPVHTLRWIGAIQVAAYLTGTPNSCTMASHAKAFWTDDKLKHFGLYPTGLRHGKDALRHLLYYMLFPQKAGA